MSGLHGIVMHWTAGGHKASALDRKHYHFMVEADGNIVKGDRRPEDNLNTADGTYAAHTLNANTGRIGVAVCGMMGAVERPFNPGKSPLTWPQVNALTALAARLCAQYGIPVSRETVLTHAEVQPTLKIAQKGKWDITWLPGMAAAGDPVAVGDRLRADISKALKGGPPTPVAPPPATPAAETPKGFWAALFEALMGILKGRKS